MHFQQRAALKPAANKALAAFEAKFSPAQHQNVAPQYARCYIFYCFVVFSTIYRVEQSSPSLNNIKQPQSNLHSSLHLNEPVVLFQKGEELRAFDSAVDSFRITSDNAWVLASLPGHTRYTEDMKTIGRG